MSLDLARAEDRPIGSVDELVALFAAAERPKGTHLVGLEHEKFLYPAGGAAPVPYEGERGVGALLTTLVREGHDEFREAPQLPTIALTRGKATISLEPGGQLELSGAPAATARA